MKFMYLHHYPDLQTEHFSKENFQEPCFGPLVDILKVESP